jgi:CheY-like chemotaxis protein
VLIVSERLDTHRQSGVPRAAPRAARASAQPADRLPCVLVVEDTPVHLLLIERALRKRGVREILKAASGAEALNLLGKARDDESLRPDLIVLDLQLPGVSGFHVLVAVRSMPDFRDTPIVILTYSDSETDAARCMAAGADAFVSKTDDYDEFRNSVFQIMDLWETFPPPT